MLKKSYLKVHPNKNCLLRVSSRKTYVEILRKEIQLLIQLIIYIEIKTILQKMVLLNKKLEKNRIASSSKILPFIMVSSKEKIQKILVCKKKLNSFTSLNKTAYEKWDYLVKTTLTNGVSHNCEVQLKPILILTLEICSLFFKESFSKNQKFKVSHLEFYTKDFSSNKPINMRFNINQTIRLIIEKITLKISNLRKEIMIL
uniref:hypothetical protein n=1 Tax=Cryptomonas gyropyrenoidosa TaxID=233257 RepID=UPI00279E8ADE|nr:hypothetical protein QLP26_pgp003 [Cryptomonas gyropyrenoidosa]WFQ82913.1 hypothetical protein [Cryptomonas gyropyrenoidosa]